MDVKLYLYPDYTDRVPAQAPIDLGIAAEEVPQGARVPTAATLANQREVTVDKTAAEALLRCSPVLKIGF